MRVTLRLLFAAAAVGVAAVVAVPASAWEYSVVNGQAGHVWMPPVFPFEADRFTTYGPYLTFLTFEAPYVYRSPATSGAQQIQAIYVIKKYAGGSSWPIIARQELRAYTIPAGAEGVYIPKMWRTPAGNAQPRYQRGHFQIHLLVAWADEYGRGLGSSITSPNRVGDLRCRQMVRPCHATAQWVRLGRMFSLGGGW